MSRDALVDEWRREENEPFEGWDFAHIASRYRAGHPPWSYEESARKLVRRARRALDLGTGGGEILAPLHDAFPPLIVATEAYRPNVPVAQRRLAPLGVRVVAYGGGIIGPGASRAQDVAPPLPFRDASFDVVLARHEAYNAEEVARVLAPGGTFLTQQVDGRSNADLLELFGAAAHWPHVTLAHLADELTGAGLEITDARSWWGAVAFSDVGALVYYLKAIPWMVPTSRSPGSRERSGASKSALTVRARLRSGRVASSSRRERPRLLDIRCQC